MRIRHVQYFLALVDERNFTRAAERCDVAQPSLTAGIQRLEHEFGGSLFHRERRDVRLSALGLAILPCMEQIGAAVERAARLAKEHHPDPAPKGNRREDVRVGPS